jgi:hypothetical protein
MFPGKNPAYDLEFDRLRPVGERRMSAGDPAENGASTVNDSALFPPPVCGVRAKRDSEYSRSSATWGRASKRAGCGSR